MSIFTQGKTNESTDGILISKYRTTKTTATVMTTMATVMTTVYKGKRGNCPKCGQEMAATNISRHLKEVCDRR